MLKKIIEVCMVAIIAVSIVYAPVVVQAATPAEFTNGSFEELDSDGMPSGWVKYSWKIATKQDLNATTFTVMTDGNGKDGNNYMKITNVVTDDSRLIYALKVKPNEKYKVTCWAKTEDVGQNKAGANISIGGNLVISKDLKGNNDWRLLEYYFESNNSNRADLTIGVGSYGRDNTGTAYFDDVKVEKIDEFPAGVTYAKVNDESKKVGDPEQKSNTVTTIIIIIGVLVVLGIAAVILLNNKKKSSTESIEDEDNSYTELDVLGEANKNGEAKLKEEDDDDDDTSL